jgi:hypothetical protein
MKRENIEKAAEECRRTTAQSMGVYGQYHSIDECPNHGISCDELVESSFIKGAEWRINSVWHKPCDIAEPGKNCLVEHMDGDGNVCICIDWRSEYEWVNACHYDKILRWAYIEDLLPNEQQKP